MLWLGVITKTFQSCSALLNGNKSIITASIIQKSLIPLSKINLPYEIYLMQHRWKYPNNCGFNWSKTNSFLYLTIGG